MSHLSHIHLGLMILLCTFTAGGCSGVSVYMSSQINEANKAYAIGQFSRTDQLMSAALTQEPTSPAIGEAMYLRGLARVRMGQRTTARQDFLEVLKEADDPTLQLNAQIMLGSLAYDDGNCALAVRYYKPAAEQIPQAPYMGPAMVRLATCMQKLGQWDQAREILSKVIDQHRGSVSARQARARFGYDHFTIQAGAFADADNAENLATTLRTQGLADVHIQRELSSEQYLRVVRVGRYQTYREAVEQLSRVQQFVPDALIVP